MSQSAEIILHIWPGRWNLPSIDPTCLATVMHLYLLFPGKFVIEECVNPDLSPSGQLPFLTHGHHVVSSLPSIVRYLTSLKTLVTQEGENYLSGGIDAELNASEKSQCVAWRAHVESNLGDLVAHTFYSLQTNWLNLTHKTLVSMFPIPQRYYVPGRIRDSYRTRLEASGLWNIPGGEQEEEKPFREIKKPVVQDRSTKYTEVFEREKTLEKARSLFDLYQRLLGGKRFFYHDRPTTLDVALASHLLLLINAPFPDPLLKTLLTESYPSLVTHANSVQAEALPLSEDGIKKLPPQGYSLRSLVPLISSCNPAPSGKPSVQTDADIQFGRMRWGWIGLAATSVIVYFLRVGLPIQLGFAEDVDEEGVV